MEILKITGTAFLIGFMSYFILIRLLKGMGMLDTPGGRKIHRGEVPSMGGIGFVAATFISIMIWFDYDQFDQIRYLLASFLLMFIVGFRDDMLDLSVFQKLGSQVVAAFLVVVLGDIRLVGFYGFLGIYELPIWMSYLFSMFTIVALTNAFNLIDGLDGLAGGLALVILMFLSWWFKEAGLAPFAYFSYALAAGIASFLVFNWRPAKIFMGDTGSMSLGFALSVLVILFIHTNATAIGLGSIQFMAPLASGIAILIIPIFDTLQVFSRRIWKGKSPFEPDNMHIHHLLLKLGLDHDKVTLSLMGIKICFIGLIFLGADLNDHIMLPLIFLISTVLAIVLSVFSMQRVEKLRNVTSPLMIEQKEKKEKE
ncbi:undecaprenyl/decaprenyl-phosphate alpha-N-acetylglucosaminyl 1-phosphate transferase [Aquiflexum sp. LQ15W]|uniref:glycosyltransferase family 4 protein n=1 Tax=Cognataquiflexum nitidum TaxID=2922272 RepID=UPI001F13E48E|nr:undecaprenyl/decaprenyl-phosphate alpha-N-acetylglucosaminyl 1-phosphate transferase [Cognataquiflexum nitidum]MCH6201327.1 undecaprenyl/decaprenyl-phosphate alpha-N-acetylglucosaminyl 1-phosphate transferase [Cognataquiflexum nitidum]